MPFTPKLQGKAWRLNDIPCVPVDGAGGCKPDEHNQKLGSDGSRVNESDWRFHYWALGPPFGRMRNNARAQPRPHLLCLHIVTGTGAQAITLTLYLCWWMSARPLFSFKCFENGRSLLVWAIQDVPHPLSWFVSLAWKMWMAIRFVGEVFTMKLNHWSHSNEVQQPNSWLILKKVVLVEVDDRNVFDV